MTPQDLNTDTIVAIATPPGEGGIGVLRLSGNKAAQICQKIWRGKREVTDFESHRLYLGDFCHPETEEKLDTGLAVWMKAPRSFTGEDVFELHAHGGPLLLNQLLELLVSLGARIAEPGEFTRRAFLNGKMDLLQAEAVAEMIHAKSSAALRNAKSQLEGRLSKQVDELRVELIDLLARVESAIDFPEEDIEIIQPKQTLARIEKIDACLKEWMAKFRVGRLLREGVKIALVGRPNVGKSSLLNYLLQEERAIVHESPGTTRDVIEGFIQINGVAFQIFDTAGMRQGEDPVEQEGIARSQKVMEQADLTLWILDRSEELKEEDFLIAKSINGTVLVVGNKADRKQSWDQLSEQIYSLSPWGRGPGRGVLPISAKTGQGIPELKATILKTIGLNNLNHQSQSYLNNARHLSALQSAASALQRAHESIKKALPAECTAADLRETTHHLAALLGKVNTEEILDKIFREFCIGK